MLVLTTHNWIFENIRTYDTVEILADDVFKPFIFITKSKFARRRSHCHQSTRSCARSCVLPDFAGWAINFVEHIAHSTSLKHWTLEKEKYHFV